ncbi:MAG: type II toxin-antitoxin system RelE/ParE family toxin [bacterium]|nr:type II toxin-antitoxin system RelE/ParE family toxin [bacterium]
MHYKLLYHQKIVDDLKPLPQNIKTRIRKAIESRLLQDPFKYGLPLKRGLHGYRKLRVGDYRVIFKIEKDEIIILKISHRKEVYSKVSKRT